MKKWLILCLISTLANAQLPDYAKEMRWAEQIEDSIMDGEAIWLTANGHRFLSIYTPSEIHSKRAALIIHGLGAHPDWAQVIQPLRVALSEQGWHTLSVQMPVLANDKTAVQYLPLLPRADERIQAAIRYLQRQNLRPEAIVAHSFGGVMSAHYLNHQTRPIKYFVAIGLPDLSLNYLQNIRIPMLDLYGVDDIKPVLSSIDERAQRSKNNKYYSQKIVNADHFFNDKNDLLIDTVDAWLN